MDCHFYPQSDDDDDDADNNDVAVDAAAAADADAATHRIDHETKHRDDDDFRSDSNSQNGELSLDSDKYSPSRPTHDQSDHDDDDHDDDDDDDVHIQRKVMKSIFPSYFILKI